MPEAVHHAAGRVRDHRARAGGGVGDHRRPASCPAAIEMMDALAIEAAEAAVACAYPAGRRRGAASWSSTARPRRWTPSSPTVRALCRAAGAFELRAADDPAERAAIWKGRKSAFAAVGRISPAYIVQDGVVPRTALPARCWPGSPAVRASTASGWPTCSTPGDGNLHPLVLFDDAEPGAGERGRGGVRRDPRPVHRARRLDHRRARRRRGQVPVHAEDVHRRRPGHHAAGPLRLRPGAACPTRARSSPPRGCAARCPGARGRRTRWSSPARRSSSDGTPNGSVAAGRRRWPHAAAALPSGRPPTTPWPGSRRAWVASPRVDRRGRSA